MAVVFLRAPLTDVHQLLRREKERLSSDAGKLLSERRLHGLLADFRALKGSAGKFARNSNAGLLVLRLVPTAFDGFVELDDVSWLAVPLVDLVDTVSERGSNLGIVDSHRIENGDHWNLASRRSPTLDLKVDEANLLGVFSFDEDVE